MKKLILFLINEKSLIYLLFLGIFSYFISYLFNTIVSHYLSPSEYGDFSIAIRSVFFISVLLLTGTNLSSVKYFSNYFESSDIKGMNRFLNWNIKLIIRTFSLSVVAFIIFYITLILLDYISIKNFTSYHFAVYAFWLAPFSAMYILLASYLLSIKLNNLSLFFNKIAAYLFLVILLLVAVFFFEIKIHYFHILSLLFITFCIIITIEILLLRRIVAKKNLRLSLKLKSEPPSKVEHKNWVKDSINFTSVLLVFNLLFIVDILIIEWIHPSEHATGYYAAILVIGSILWEIPKAITSYIAPRIEPLLKNSHYNELQKILNTTNKISLPVIAVLFVMIIVFSNFLLKQFGPMYTQVQTPLIILCIGYFFGATSLANAKVLMYLDSKKIMQINILEAVILIVLGIILTFFFGLIGMSFSVMISSTSKAVIMYYYVKKKLPVKPYGLF